MGEMGEMTDYPLHPTWAGYNRLWVALADISERAFWAATHAGESSTKALLDIYALAEATIALPTCRVCGCTDDVACEGGCEWAEPGLCTSCGVTGFSCAHCGHDRAEHPEWNDGRCIHDPCPAGSHRYTAPAAPAQLLAGVE